MKGNGNMVQQLLNNKEELLESIKEIELKLNDIKNTIESGKELDQTQVAFLKTIL